MSRFSLVEKAIIALDRREVALDDRLEAVEAKVRTDQLETAAERGLPADLVSTEENVWKRLTPTRNRWPEIAAFDERAAELEMRQAEVQAELQQLHEQARTAPDRDSAALAEWELGDRKGRRPEPTLPAIEAEIRERQAEWDALTVAVGRVLAEKTQHVERHRGRLIEDADRRADATHRRYLELIDQLEDVREDVRASRRDCVWSRLFPDGKAGAETPDSLAGARKAALAPLGVSAAVAPGRVFDALRADADWLRRAGTPEQLAAMGEGRDPRQPPSTQWHDDPSERAKRDRRMAEWASRR